MSLSRLKIIFSAPDTKSISQSSAMNRLMLKFGLRSGSRDRSVTNDRLSGKRLSGRLDLLLRYFQNAYLAAFIIGLIVLAAVFR